MRSRIVTPEEMRTVFAAKVSEFPYSFRLRRLDASRLEKPETSLPVPGRVEPALIFIPRKF